MQVLLPRNLFKERQFKATIIHSRQNAYKILHGQGRSPEPVISIFHIKRDLIFLLEANSDFVSLIQIHITNILCLCLFCTVFTFY